MRIDHFLYSSGIEYGWIQALGIRGCIEDYLLELLVMSYQFLNVWPRVPGLQRSLNVFHYDTPEFLDTVRDKRAKERDR